MKYDDIHSMTTNPATEAANKAIDRIMQQREEILEAFVAKYGADPDQVEQVEQRMGNGSIRWFVRIKDQAPSDRH